METYMKLQKNRDELLELYIANLEDVYDLQDTLIQSILPSVTDELGLGSEAREWAKEWLSDTSSIFRISKRNKFIRSFCLEAVRKTLLWRFRNLWPLEPPLRLPNLQCLPAEICDPFGRPILVLRMDPIDEEASSHKRNILVRAFEVLRIHLRQLYDNSSDDNPILQYVVLVDLSALTLQTIDFTGIGRELIPKFPGMVGAVFMLNYSWAHSGIWGVIKRLLPEAALSRIFFPSDKELIECLTPAALPQEFGGSLPLLAELDDPLRPRLVPSTTLFNVDREPQPTVSTVPLAESVSRLSSMSALNPFYGYPVVPTRGLPTLRHGRRRKRDLLRTLTKLFWLRWHNQINTALCLVISIILFKLALRKGLLYLPHDNPLSSLFFFDRTSAG